MTGPTFSGKKGSGIGQVVVGKVTNPISTTPQETRPWYCAKDQDGTHFQCIRLDSYQLTQYLLNDWTLYGPYFTQGACSAACQDNTNPPPPPAPSWYCMRQPQSLGGLKQCMSLTPAQLTDLVANAGWIMVNRYDSQNECSINCSNDPPPPPEEEWYCTSFDGVKECQKMTFAQVEVLLSQGYIINGPYDSEVSCMEKCVDDPDPVIKWYCMIDPSSQNGERSCRELSFDELTALISIGWEVVEVHDTQEDCLDSCADVPISSWYCLKKDEEKDCYYVTPEQLATYINDGYEVDGSFSLEAECQEFCADVPPPPPSYWYCVKPHEGDKECRFINLDDLNTLVHDGWTVEGGPFTEEEVCLKNCSAIDPPPPPEGYWHCMERLSDGFIQCSLLTTEQLNVMLSNGWVSNSIHETQEECLASCQPPEPQEPQTMPLVAIQMWMNPVMPSSLFSSALWGLDFVIPYIEEAYWSYSGDTRSIQTRVDEYINYIKYVRDQIAIYHPNKQFRWAWWPHGYAAWNDSFFQNILPLNHPDDRITVAGVGQMNSVFTANSRAVYSAVVSQFIDALVLALNQNGLPMPEYVNPDMEALHGGGIPVTDDQNRFSLWHSWIMADPRSTTELIDGTLTYAQWANQLEDWDGNHIPSSELYPWIYDGSKYKQVGSIYSIYSRIADWFLEDTLYKHVRAKMPGCKCTNWGSFGSTADPLVNNYRFKEAPVGFGSTFKGDMMMPTLYGNLTNDVLTQPVGQGFNTFNEQMLRFDIDPNDFVNNKNELAREIHVKYIEYLLEGVDKADPSRRHAISLTWPGSSGFGPFGGPQVFSNSQLYPSYYLGASLNYNDNSDLLTRIFNTIRRYDVQLVEFFVPFGSLAGFDSMYNFFAGYISTDSWWCVSPPGQPENRECQQLGQTELLELVDDGWTIVEGPYDSANTCSTSCAEIPDPPPPPPVWPDFANDLSIPAMPPYHKHPPTFYMENSGPYGPTLTFSPALHMDLFLHPYVVNQIMFFTRDVSAPNPTNLQRNPGYFVDLTMGYITSLKAAQESAGKPFTRWFLRDFSTFLGRYQSPGDTTNSFYLTDRDDEIKASPTQYNAIVPWSGNGIVKNRSWWQEYFSLLKTRLDQQGIPYPEMYWNDDETAGGGDRLWFGCKPYDATGNHTYWDDNYACTFPLDPSLDFGYILNYLADPKASSSQYQYLIDGSRNFADFWAGMRDTSDVAWDGCFYTDNSGYRGPASAPMTGRFGVLRSVMVYYAMWKSLVEPMRQNFPNACYASYNDMPYGHVPKYPIRIWNTNNSMPNLSLKHGAFDDLDLAAKRPGMMPAPNFYCYPDGYFSPVAGLGNAYWTPDLSHDYNTRLSVDPRNNTYKNARADFPNTSGGLFDDYLWAQVSQAKRLMYDLVRAYPENPPVPWLEMQKIYNPAMLHFIKYCIGLGIRKFGVFNVNGSDTFFVDTRNNWKTILNEIQSWYPTWSAENGL